MHFGSKFGNLILDRWWIMARTSSKYGFFLLFSEIWPWSSRSITPQNNRNLNQGLLLLWSKFGDSSLNAWQVIARTSKLLPHTQTHRQTDAANDNTRRPKLASGKDLWNKWNPISKGVPQDSILGPLLFNIFINYIFFLDSNGLLFNYADDNCLSYTGNKVELIAKTLTSDIDALR